MQIQHITISHFQGVPFFDQAIDDRVTLIAGSNNCGKTTVRDAIRFALTGDADRVSLKKDYPQLVYAGADAKKAEVMVKVNGHEFRRKVATGKGSDSPPDLPAILPFLDGSEHLAALKRDERQKTLAQVVPMKANKDQIEKMLTEKGVDEGMFPMVLPMLRSGFDAAHSEAKQRKSEAVGAWKALTGENYGSAKAADWTAPAPEAGADEDPEKLKSDLKETEAKLSEMIESGSGLEQERKQLAQGSNANLGTRNRCPHCEEWVWVRNGSVFKETEAPSKEQIEANQKRLDEIDSDLAPIKEEVARLQERQGEIRAALIRAREAAQSAEALTEKAAEYHRQVEAWQTVIDALAPTGIPLELMAEALKPLNARLDETAKQTGWPRTEITPQLEVTVGGRVYGLLSESEQWRADAAIAEALSILSGANFFILDRFDVLSVPNRNACLKWLGAVNGDHDNVFVMGTLKARPTLPEDTFNVLWLEGGRVATVEKAA